MSFINFNFKDNDEELCLANSATTHTNLKNKKHISSLTSMEANVNTISGTVNLIDGSGRANIILSGETKFVIYDVLFSLRLQMKIVNISTLFLESQDICKY